MQQTVVVVVGIGGLQAVDGAVKAIAHGVVLVGGAVVAINGISEALCGEPIKGVVGILAGAATQLVNLASVPGGVQVVLVLLYQGAQAIVGAEFDQSIEAIVLIKGAGAVAMTDAGAVTYDVVTIAGDAMLVADALQTIEGIVGIVGDACDG